MTIRKDGKGPVWPILVLLLFLMLAVSMEKADAGDFYGVLGVGKSTLQQHPQDGHWVQRKLPHTIDEDSAAGVIGLGYSINRWVDVELDYRKLGTYHGDIQAVTDKAYHAGDLRKPSRWVTAGRTHGWGLSAVVGPDWTWAPYVRGGVFYHWSRFTATKTAYGSSKSTTYDYTVVDGERMPLGDNGFGLMYGAGLRYKNLAVEYTVYPKAAAGGSAYHNIDTLTVSVRVPF